MCHWIQALLAYLFLKGFLLTRTVNTVYLFATVNEMLFLMSSKGCPDLRLQDYNLPSSDGDSALQLIQCQCLNANYFIFIDLAAFTRSTNYLIDTFVHYLHQQPSGTVPH